MIRRLLSASMVMAVSLSASSAIFASPLHIHAPVHAKMGKVKLIHVTLRNDSKAQMKVTVGTRELTLAPGETTSTKLNEGDKIVANEGCTEPSGTVLAVVASAMANTTIGLR